MLRPCPGCRRHVDVDAALCVFCAVTLPAMPRSPSRIGRMSRAAIFAGAITIAGCGEAPPRYVTNPNATATSGVVQGRVLTHDGDPAANKHVTLYGEVFRDRPGSNGDSLTTISDAKGNFGFNDIPVGEYRMAVSGSRKQRKVRVRSGQSVVLEVELDEPEPIDTRHMAKPYGAPPARRRVV